jgi:hypothetical protein
MAYRFSAAALANAIKDLCKYGDTDVFPLLPELAFLREQEAAVIKEFAVECAALRRSGFTV